MPRRTQYTRNEALHAIVEGLGDDVTFLSKDEEIAAWVRWRDEKDDGRRSELRRELSTHYIPWMIRLTMELAWKGEEPAELMADAYEGFCEALDRFDPSHGRLVTYCSCWIRNRINRGRANLSIERPYRIPVHMYDAWMAASARQQAEAREGRRVSMAKAAELCEGYVARDAAYFDRLRSVAIQEPSIKSGQASDNAENSVPDLIRHAAQNDRFDMGEYRAVRAAIDLLPPRQRKCLLWYYGLDGPRRTFVEIGQSFGVTRERARQICADAEVSVRRAVVFGQSQERNRKRVREAIKELRASAG